MRRLWRQAPRPQLSSTSAPRTSIRSAFGRRATAAHGARSKVAACDVFAVFLAPLLAAAAFADTSWKESKRREWERRFNEISEEVERLRAREVEVWTRIQHRSIKHGVLLHRRMYSTAAASAAHDLLSPEEWVDTMKSDTPDANMMDGPFADRGRYSTWAGAATVDVPAPSPGDSAQIRYEKLLVHRLVLRMLLNTYSGGDPKYAHKYENLIANKMLPEEIGNVVIRLHSVSEELKRLFHTRLQKTPGRPRSMTQTSQHLENRKPMLQLALEFENEQIDRQQLVDKVIEWLLKYNDPPLGAHIYSELVILFTTCGLEELAAFAISALRNTGYILYSSDIVAMIEYSSRLRDIRSFDWLIHDLTSTNGLVRRASKPWEWWKRNGVLVAGPAHFNPFIYRSLIKAHLSFGHVRRAEAYYDLAQNFGWSDVHQGMSIKAFLQYYAINLDWTGGLVWAGRALEYLQNKSLLPQFKTMDRLSGVLGIITLRLADLLLACEKRTEFAKLLDIAVQSGIEPPRVNHKYKPRSDSLVWIVSQWNLKISELGRAQFSEANLSDFQARVRSFAEMMTIGCSDPIRETQSFQAPGAGPSDPDCLAEDGQVPPTTENLAVKAHTNRQVDFMKVIELMKSERAKFEDRLQQQREAMQVELKKARDLDAQRQQNSLELLRQQQQDAMKSATENFRLLEAELQTLRIQLVAQNGAETAKTPVVERSYTKGRDQLRATAHATDLRSTARPNGLVDPSKDEDSGYDSSDGDVPAVVKDRMVSATPTPDTIASTQSSYGPPSMHNPPVLLDEGDPQEERHSIFGTPTNSKPSYTSFHARVKALQRDQPGTAARHVITYHSGSLDEQAAPKPSKTWVTGEARRFPTATPRTTAFKQDVQENPPEDDARRFIRFHSGGSVDNAGALSFRPLKSGIRIMRLSLQPTESDGPTAGVQNHSAPSEAANLAAAGTAGIK